MPVCFQLFNRATNEPVSLRRLDDDLRAWFGAPVDDVHYFRDWYDTIGLRLALGKSFDQIRVEFLCYEEKTRIAAPHESTWYRGVLEVLDMIECAYSSESWREIGRRA